MPTAAQPPEGHELTPDDYLESARDHLVALPSVYSSGDYAIAMYMAGVAVECLFRAFRARNGMPFRSDHTLSKLAVEAEFPKMVPIHRRDRFDAALTGLILRWRNSHRYRSKAAMRRFLKGLRLDRGIRGDYLKENARQLMSDAIELVNLGIQRWQQH